MEIVNEDGEIISQETVEYAYTRDGRKEIGKEYPDPRPMELPFGHEPHEPVWEMIRRMVLEHAKQAAEKEEGEEFDTEEEANDFDVGDDYDPASPWEEHHEPTDPWPMSTAARELEQRIIEHRNKGRIEDLKLELEALQAGKEWPPAPPSSDSPLPKSAPGDSA